MNTHIQRIKILNERIAALDKMVAQGECFAAGIGIEITVGANPRSGDTLNLDFGLVSDMKDIFAVMRQGLVDARAWHLRQAQSDLKELTAFFDEEPTR